MYRPGGGAQNSEEGGVPAMSLERWLGQVDGRGDGQASREPLGSRGWGGVVRGRGEICRGLKGPEP